MQVRIIQDFNTATVRLKTGDIIDVKPATADRWVDENKAIYLKIINPSEYK